MKKNETQEALAPAKINLCLHVGPVRDDGYHPVCSLMEKVTLFDTLRARRSGREGVRLLGTEIPAPENIVFRAARALEEETGAVLAVDIELAKEIPVAAGLAGGSSDAAAALKLLVSMFNLPVSPSRLAAIASALGADVPFFMQPGPQIAEGAGEVLQPAGVAFDYHIVLVAPPVAVPTADAYRLFDKMSGPSGGGFTGRSREVHEAVAGLDSLGSLAGMLHNDLEPAAITLCPEVAGIKRQLLGLGAAGALMSGSGPGVFGLFAGKNDAATAARRLGESYSRVWVVKPLR